MREEKSNYGLSFVGFGKDDEKIRNGYISNPSKEIYQVEDLRKNEFEIRVIRYIIKIYNKLIDDLGLDVAFNPDISRVHVLSKKEFRKKLGDDLEGKCGFYHVYLYRQTKCRFVHILTHELAHFLSYESIMVTKESDKSFVARNDRSGLESQDQSFSGLNEALTEIVALRARLSLVEEGSFLNGREAKELISSWAYDSNIRIYEEIIRRSGKSAIEITRIFTRSYILGNDDFIREIRLSEEQIEQLKAVNPNKLEARNFLQCLNQGAE